MLKQPKVMLDSASATKLVDASLMHRHQTRRLMLVLDAEVHGNELRLVILYLYVIYINMCFLCASTTPSACKMLYDYGHNEWQA